MTTTFQMEGYALFVLRHSRVLESHLPERNGRDYIVYLSLKTRTKKAGSKKQQCPHCGRKLKRLDIHLRLSATCKHLASAAAVSIQSVQPTSNNVRHPNVLHPSDTISPSEPSPSLCAPSMPPMLEPLNCPLMKICGLRQINTWLLQLCQLCCQHAPLRTRTMPCALGSTHTSPVSMVPDRHSLAAEPGNTKGLGCPWPNYVKSATKCGTA